uniref:Uncharacterized protein n=1 Tax=Sorghum bicolor TaxID=4558 RepID=C6JSE6_SORBI
MRHHKNTTAITCSSTIIFLVGYVIVGPIWTSHHSNCYLSIHHKRQTHLKNWQKCMLGLRRK